MWTMIIEDSLEPCLDCSTNIQDRKCPNRTMTRMINTPQMHPHCHIDRRGSEPHQTPPQGHIQITMNVVNLPEAQ
jgi:hypothetical protein